MLRAHTSGNEECRCLADDVGRVPGSFEAMIRSIGVRPTAH
jgi:hypothetical protein